MKDSIFNRYELFARWDESFLHFLPRIVLAVVVLAAFYFLAKIVRHYSFRLYSKILKKQSALARIISLTLYAVLITSGGIFALEILGLESYVTKVLAGAGIIGIVAGFAFKDIAANMFAGILVNLQKPFKENDWVNIAGTFGAVDEIGWITTSIKNIGGQEVFVPNQLIYKSSFTNYSVYGKRRVSVRGGVTRGDDLEKVKNVALDEVGQMREIMKTEAADFYFTEIGSSAYNFEVRFWIEFVNQTDYLNALSEAIIRLNKRFRDEDIAIAYPVRALDFGVKGGVGIFDNPLEVTSLNRDNGIDTAEPKENIRPGTKERR